MRTSAAIERWPIGPTGEARCTAFTVRSAPTLPVHPGCEIRWAMTRMRESLLTWVARGTEKSNRCEYRFSHASGQKLHTSRTDSGQPNDRCLWLTDAINGLL